MRSYEDLDIKNHTPSVSRDYGTLMLVGKINSFFGWILAFGAIGGFIFGIVKGPPIMGFACLAALPFALVTIASGQVISCFVSIERNGHDTTMLLTKLLEKNT